MDRSIAVVCPYWSFKTHSSVVGGPVQYDTVLCALGLL